MNFSEAKNQLGLEGAFCTKLRRYLDEFEAEVHMFRPEVYSLEHFASRSSRVNVLAMSGYLVYMSFCSLLFLPIEVLPYLDRCRSHPTNMLVTQNQFMNLCNPFQLFSIPDTVMLIEFPVIFVLVYCVTSLILILYLLVSSFQCDLITSMRSLVLASRTYILHEGRLFEISQSSIASEPLTPKKSSANMNGNSLGTEKDPDKFILQNLIKLIVCESELRDNSRSMSQLTINPFYYAAVLVASFALVSVQFKVPETKEIRRLLIIAGWMNVNSLLIYSAHVFSKIIRFERVTWLVLAAQSSRFNQSALEPSPTAIHIKKALVRGDGQEMHRISLRSCSLVSDLWVKFVYATSLNIERYCARPLKLTSGRWPGQ